MIDLTKFCDPNDIREYLRTPFLRGNEMCACDGNVLIMVDLDLWDGKYHEMDEPDLSKLMNNFNAVLDYFTLPQIAEPEHSVCADCGGTGRLKTCPDCDGTGERECDLGHYHDCKTCEGEGYVRGGDDVDCYRCSGTGKEYRYNARVTLTHHKIKVDVDWRLLQKFADLPNVEIALQGPGLPVVIRFDGGRGLLMPLRKAGDDIF